MSLECRCHGKNTLEGERRLTAGRRKRRWGPASRLRRHRPRQLGHESVVSRAAHGAVVPSTGGRRPLQRRGGGAARAPGAAGGPPAAPLARRGGRPGAAARPRPAAAACSSRPTGCRRWSSGARPAPARPRSPASSPARPEGVRAAVGGDGRGQGRARGRRARPGPHRRAAAGARSSSSTRCTASTGPSRTRCSRTWRRGCSSSIGATTENPFFSLTGPLLSRSTLFRLEPLERRRPARRCCAARSPTTSAASATSTSTIDDDALDHLADRAEGDARHALTVARGRRGARGRVRSHARSPSPTPRPRSRCERSATATTSTTTCCRRSSRASAAPTSTPGSTGSPACSRRARTRA